MPVKIKKGFSNISRRDVLKGLGAVAATGAGMAIRRRTKVILAASVLRKKNIKYPYKWGEVCKKYGLNPENARHFKLIQTVDNVMSSGSFTKRGLAAPGRMIELFGEFEPTQDGCRLLWADSRNHSGNINAAAEVRAFQVLVEQHPVVAKELSKLARK